MEEIKQHLPETRFAWMGGFGDNDVFYYKVHNPVLLVELDMHKGVFLNTTTSRRSFTSTSWSRRRTATTTARTCCGSTWSGSTTNRTNPSGALLEPR